MADQTLHLSGIYVIRSIACGRIYIGSSYNVYNRWKEHRRLLAVGKHHSYKLQASWNKHESTNFSIDILEVVNDKTLRLKREQFWMDFLSTCKGDRGFNVRVQADSNLGTKFPFRPKSHSHRAAISAARQGHPVSQETRAKLRAANLGKKTHTIASKEKLRSANLGKKMSPDAIARTAASWRGKRHKPEAIAKMRARKALKKTPSGQGILL